jgi:hypothetical protein
MAGDRGDESRIGGGIAQRLTEFADSRMKSVLEVYKRVAPKIASEFLVGDQFAGRLE